MTRRNSLPGPRMVLAEHVFERGRAHARRQRLPVLRGSAFRCGAFVDITIGKEICVRVTHGLNGVYACPT